MSKILNWPLNSGKTTELVKMMLEPGNEDVVYVAPTYQQAEFVGYGTALKLGAEPTRALRDRFIGVAKIDIFRRSAVRPRFVVDEFDGVLSALLFGEIIAVAGTDESEKAAYLADPAGYGKEEV